jgi:3'-phosphoadenosine 5'-phosphosulfate sulfotransferase (PAPS reductase)/FAD synthetase
MSSWLEKWREYFLAWYDEGGVGEKAREAADFACRYADSGMVSVSGGKDSMTLLHIVASICRGDVDVFHWDHGPALMPREVEHEILQNIRTVAPKARVVVETYSLGDSERARADWRPWYREFFSTLERLDYRHHILGIRAEESSRRRGRGRVVDRGRWVEVHPIYYFTWRDVWAYVFKHNVPVPRVYYIYARYVGWDKARLTTFHDREFEKYGNQIDAVLMWREKNYVARRNLAENTADTKHQKTEHS